MIRRAQRALPLVVMTRARLVRREMNAFELGRDLQRILDENGGTYPKPAPARHLRAVPTEGDSQ